MRKLRLRDSTTAQGLSACQTPKNPRVQTPRAGDGSRLGPLGAGSAPIAQSPFTALTSPARVGAEIGCVWAGPGVRQSTQGTENTGRERELEAGLAAGQAFAPGAPAWPGGAGRAPAAPGGGSGHCHWPPSPGSGGGAGPGVRLLGSAAAAAAAGGGRGGSCSWPWWGWGGGGEGAGPRAEGPSSPPPGQAPFLALKGNHYRICIQLLQQTFLKAHYVSGAVLAWSACKNGIAGVLPKLASN